MIVFEGLQISLTFKAVKNINLRIASTDGKISLSAPYGTPQKTLIAFLNKHKAWLKQKLADSKPPPSGEGQIEYWGRLMPLRIIEKPGPIQIITEPDEIALLLPELYSKTIITKIIDNWKKAQVIAKAKPLLKHWEKSLGLTNVSLRCKKMKSRWGSCAWYKNLITLNSELAGKLEACLELVIVHELIHFYEHNHSSAFYQKLAAILPDWKKRAQCLKTLSA